MAEHEYWLTKLENKIFWLYLNRPERKNAFDLAVADELYQILEEEVEKDLENIRVLSFDFLSSISAFSLPPKAGSGLILDSSLGIVNLGRSRLSK